VRKRKRKAIPQFELAYQGEAFKLAGEIIRKRFLEEL